MVDRTNKMIDLEKKEIIANYERNWERMISEWKSNDPRDAFWLMFSACYLFRTNGIRWALDPVSLLNRLSKTHTTNFADDLKGLSFVSISHSHVDHFDRVIVNNLAGLGIKWVIPITVLDEILESTGLEHENIVIIHPGETVEFNNILIKAYEGLHDNGKIMINAASFYVKTDQLSMFFPGDVRCYEQKKLPHLSSLDYYFAHLWLGYETALDHTHDLLLPFCEFSASQMPKNIIITHLFEAARTNSSYWNEVHANKAKKIFTEKYPDIKIRIPLLTEGVFL